MDKIPVNQYNFKRISKGQNGMRISAYRKWRKKKAKMAKKTKSKRK